MLETTIDVPSTNSKRLDSGKGFSNEHWSGLTVTINTWLFERQELITLYCSLSATISQNNFSNRLTKFCEILVDYISVGHFEVFAELEAEARTFDSRGLQLVQALYPYIAQSTEAAIRFNDLCAQLADSEANSSQLRPMLSELGETLTNRFELEDQLIEYLHTSNETIAC